jgi:hypothetical protein
MFFLVYEFYKFYKHWPKTAWSATVVFLIFVALGFAAA